MLDVIDAQSLTKPRPSVTFVVDLVIQAPMPSQKEKQDANDKTPTVGTRTDPHVVLGGLLRPGADSGGDPNVGRGNGGTTVL